MFRVIFDEAAALVSLGLFMASTWLWVSAIAGG